jgi:uncharacterized membrane protein
VAASSAPNQQINNPTTQQIPLSLAVVLIAAATLAAHLALSLRYGYWIDELYFIACGAHLDWGYVDHPPLIAVIAAGERALFGDSLFGLRFLPALAGAALVLLAAAIARALGGGRTAQVIAALATLAAPVYLAFAAVLTMNGFEPLFWMGAAYLTIELTRRPRPALWLSLGVLIGVGLLNKHSMAFFTLALIGGLLISPQRRVLFDRWALLAGLVALLIVLPHVLWQRAHGWPTLELLANARRYQHQPVTPLQFFWGQIQIMQPVSLPLWLAGLCFLLVARRAAAVRFLGWAFVLQFAAFALMQAKTYYLSPAYPMLFAAGGVVVETLAQRRRWIAVATAILLVIGGLTTAPYAMPLLPIDWLPSYLRLLGIQEVRPEKRAMGNVPQIFADMLGWEELVGAVAQVYQGLPPAERDTAVLWGRDYGVAGAIDYFGPRHQLPNAISGFQNYYLWGPGERSGDVMIAIAFDRDDLLPWFEQVEPAATVHCDYCMPDRRDQVIHICRGPKLPLNEFFQLTKCWTCDRPAFRRKGGGGIAP